LQTLPSTLTTLIDQAKIDSQRWHDSHLYQNALCPSVPKLRVIAKDRTHFFRHCITDTAVASRIHCKSVSLVGLGSASAERVVNIGGRFESNPERVQRVQVMLETVEMISIL
jgi:hypothetical protein